MSLCAKFHTFVQICAIVKLTALTNDSRCTFHLQGTICNSKQRAEEFQDRERTNKKVNQRETSYRDSYELAKCCLDT